MKFRLANSRDVAHIRVQGLAHAMFNAQRQTPNAGTLPDEAALQPIWNDKLCLVGLPGSMKRCVLT